MVCSILLQIFCFQKQANQDLFFMWKNNGIKKQNSTLSLFRKKHYQVVIINENLFAFFPNAVTTTLCDYSKFLHIYKKNTKM